MGLKGDLSTIHLAEIFDLIGRGKQTGTLHVRWRSVHKWIGFRNGRLASTASNDPREYLGHFLVREGFVSEEQLFAALLRQEREGKPLGALLVAEGLVTEEDLLRVLRLKAEESCYDVFLWPQGTFEFVTAEAPPTFAVDLCLDVVAVILEGGRRADDWSRVREVIPSSRSTFLPLGDVPPDPQAARVVQAAAAGRTFASIARELRWSDYHTGVLLRDLVDAGVLRVQSAEGEEEVPDRSAAVEKLVKDGRQALKDGRIDDAGRAFEAVMLLDPLNQHAKKGLAAVVKARARQEAPQRNLLDSVPQVAVAREELSSLRLEPLESFIISRVNGTWNVKSILKLCPVAEQHALQCFESLLARGLVKLR